MELCTQGTTSGPQSMCASDKLVLLPKWHIVSINYMKQSKRSVTTVIKCHKVTDRIEIIFVEYKEVQDNLIGTILRCQWEKPDSDFPQTMKLFQPP